MKKDMLTEIQIMKGKDKNNLENLGYHLIRIHPDKTDFNDYEGFGRLQEYITKSTKKLMVNEVSKLMLEMKLKQNHKIKLKTLAYIVNKKLPLHA